jgi:hypothetical protein
VLFNENRIGAEMWQAFLYEKSEDQPLHPKKLDRPVGVFTAVPSL